MLVEEEAKAIGRHLRPIYLSSFRPSLPSTSSTTSRQRIQADFAILLREGTQTLETVCTAREGDVCVTFVVSKTDEEEGATLTPRHQPTIGHFAK